MATELAFDVVGTKYGCSLSDGSTTAYSLTAERPELSKINNSVAVESTIAYCRINDESNNLPLKTGAATVYTLTLKFATFKFSSTFIRGISLFTSTANHPEKIIIDSIPVLGSFALYGDYRSFSNKLMEINGTPKAENPSAASAKETLYPYNTVDVTINLRAKSYISAADYLIVFRYPSSTVDGPTSVTSNKVSDDSNSGPLGGTLTVKSFGTDMFYIDGVTENLYLERTFQLVIKGFKAKDTNLASAAAFDVMLFYKNTYSIVAFTTVNLFTINKPTVTITTAKHPENWDIWRHGAWPVTFSFKVDGTDLSTTATQAGYYVVIQHANLVANAAGAGNRVTFIAATCDFSATTAIDGEIGKRNNCFPLRLDQAGTAGSGIFFFMPSITAGTVYTFTVWLFADNCGGDQYDPLITTSNVYTSPTFTAAVYKNIDTTLAAEARFTTASLLNTSSAFTFTGKCWNNKIGDKTSHLLTGVYGTAGANIDVADSTTATTGKKDVMVYREFSDWQILSQLDRKACDGGGTACFANDITQAITEKFIYGSSTTAVGASYLLVRVPVYKSATDATQWWEHFPVNFSSSATANNPSGKLYFQLSSAWFQAGDSTTTSPTCYLSWGIKDADAAYTQKTLLADTTATWTATANYIPAGTGGGIDTAETYLTIPPTGTNILRIVSIFNTGSKTGHTNKFLVFPMGATAPATQTGPLVLGLMTTCVKWVTTPSTTVKSLYTYIDIQFGWAFMTSDSTARDKMTKKF